MKAYVAKLREYTRGFGKIGSMAGVTTFLPILGSAILVLTAWTWLAPWLKEQDLIGVGIFVVSMWVLSGFALMATNILGTVAGMAFDFQLGIAAQMIGLLGAATLMFFVARKYATADFVTSLDDKPRFQAVHRALLNESSARTFLLVTLIRMSPAMPFAVTNFLLSAAGVSFWVFIFGTMLGMAPRAMALVYVGTTFTEIKEMNGYEPAELVPLILGILATGLVIVIISLVSKRALANMTANH